MKNKKNEDRLFVHLIEMLCEISARQTVMSSMLIKLSYGQNLSQDEQELCAKMLSQLIAKTKVERLKEFTKSFDEDRDANESSGTQIKTDVDEYQILCEEDYTHFHIRPLKAKEETVN